MSAGPVAWYRFENLPDVSEALAEAVAVGLSAAIAARGAALLAVPGGTTPARFLKALGEHAVAWDKVTVLPTDERFVAPNDPASNERMIRETFAPLREGGAGFVSFHNAGDDLAAAAASLDKVLARLPPVDVLVSGMGADGHIASLFPGDEVAAGAGDAVHAVAARPAGLPPRISLSPARLRSAGWAALLIAGDDKEETLKAAQELPAAYPVGILLRRAQGLDVYWAKA
ncbi:6-phosphogluconolactonase [Bosea caraganae]|uniref:6-phosphogluconolactonase n=1 Tax=Bosea caraganae TaxID=2763117 RepID=A0A370L4U2_9HYPH|nr:6-phosphogluconolactonase [Bosea caraganae]RDJ22341.1 6-phosphogluconolactonase [Bosea caraganae]RDJ23725.1 6-phosphogluconolactonase [Bosea caraganae]